jgi:uncharacterized protein (TIGR03067 family)
MRVVGAAVVVMIAVACAAVGAPRPKDKGGDGRTPVDPPTGEWSVERVLVNGQVAHSKKPTEVGWTAKFTSDKWTLSLGDATIAATRVVCHQNGTVFEIDLVPEDPKTMRKGIWRVDGDILMVCVGKPGGDRPTDFTAPKESGRNLFSMKRK